MSDAQGVPQEDLINVNLQDVKSGEWPPAGPAILKVVKIENQISSTKNPMLYWEFEVLDENFGPTQFRRVWTNTSLQPNALFNLRDLVAALGVFAGIEGFRKSECMGKMCRAWIEHREIPDASRGGMKTVAGPKDFATI